MTKKNNISEVICNMCGDVYYYKDNFNEQVAKKSKNVECPQYWVHEFKLENMGYGSAFDTCKAEFHICDDCLIEIFKNMKIRPYIFDTVGDMLSSYGRRIQKIKEYSDESIEEMDKKKFYELFQKFTPERFK